MTLDRPQLSIVVPTYQEVDNLAPLTRRIFEHLRDVGLTGELIFVDDDSRDGSVELVETLTADYAVRMIVRTKERGLSTAVLAGFEHAHADVLLVMDADLSHPPEKIVELYRPISAGEADFVFGSRYASGGQTTQWPFIRKLNSWVATLLARPLTPASDPMAGFFCLARSTWKQAAPLSPLGYKIGLELLIKGACHNLKDVPIVFADRHAGKSKLNLEQQLLYLRHLIRLYRFKYPVASVLLFYVLPALILVWLAWYIVT